jgi:two-component sensor histidine kinase
LRIDWQESGGPSVGSPGHSGFGRLLLDRAIAADLQGKVAMDFAPEGLRCAIAVPLSENIAQAG